MKISWWVNTSSSIPAQIKPIHSIFSSNCKYVIESRKKKRFILKCIKSAICKKSWLLSVILRSTNADSLGRDSVWAPIVHCWVSFPGRQVQMTWKWDSTINYLSPKSFTPPLKSLKVQLICFIQTLLV